MSTAIPSAPPPAYDQKWMYWYWAWSKTWLGTGAGRGTYALAGDALGTGTLGGTATVALSTTGVAAGTYGTGGTMVAQVSVDAKGRILSATNVGISFPTSTGGGFNPWILDGDVLGTATTGTMTSALSTTGVTAGTYGTGGTMVAQVTVDAKGRVTAASNVGIAFPAGTGGGFNPWILAGDVQGTATTGTLTAVVGTMIGPVQVGTVVGSNVKIDPSDVNGIFINAIALLANGANIKLRGTGAAPSKFMRAANSRWEILNNAYSAVLFGMDDNGTATSIMMQAGTSSAGLAQAGTSTAVLIQATNASVLGTGTFGGVLSTRALNGAIGSSGSQSNAIISPYVDNVPVAMTLGGPGTLMKYGLPAGAIAGSGQGLEFTMWGTAQLGCVVGGMILKLGTATLINGTSTIAPTAWVIEGQIGGHAATQQQFFTRFAVFTNNGVGVEQINVGTLGMNLSTVTTLALFGTGTASNARQQNGMMVKFLGLQ